MVTGGSSNDERVRAATDPDDTTQLDRRRSSGGSVAPTVDGDSVDDTVSNLDSVSHDLLEYTTTTESLSFPLDLDGLRTEGGISEEVGGGIFSPLNRLRRRGSRGRASSSWTSVARAKVETAAFAVAGAADNSADRYEKRYTLAAPLSTPGVGSARGLSETGGRGISASRWPIERKRPSVGVSGSAAEELEGSGNVAEDLSSISTTITDVAAASKGERSSQALESTVNSVVTTAAGNFSKFDFTLGSVDSPSGIGSAVAGIGPATEWVSKWTGSGGRGRPRRPKQRKGGIGLESSDWRRKGAPPRLPRINLGSKKLQFMKQDTRRYLLIEACEWGDLEALKQLLGLEQGHDGVTPRRRYRADSHVPLPSLLAGAKRSAQDVSGRTPFDLCREAHPRAYEVLRGSARLLPPPRAILDYMEKVEVRGFENAAPLQQASSSGGCIGSNSLSFVGTVDNSSIGTLGTDGGEGGSRSS